MTQVYVSAFALNCSSCFWNKTTNVDGTSSTYKGNSVSSWCEIYLGGVIHHNWNGVKLFVINIGKLLICIKPIQYYYQTFRESNCLFEKSIMNLKNKLICNISAGIDVNINTFNPTLKDQPCIPFNIGTIWPSLSRPSHESMFTFFERAPLESFWFFNWNFILSNNVFNLIS